MTCIVGLIHEGTIYMGGDSAGVAGLDIVTRKDPKVFRIGGDGRPEMVVGFTSSFRMGQILQFEVQIPFDERKDAFEYMVRDFIPVVRKAFKDGGFAKVDNNVERGGFFLVGYKGRLFEIESDFQVGEPTFYANAVGCGRAYALGAIWTMLTNEHEIREPREMLKSALEIASVFSAGVRGPFIVETLSGGEG